MLTLSNGNSYGGSNGGSSQGASNSLPGSQMEAPIWGVLRTIPREM